MAEIFVQLARHIKSWELKIEVPSKTLQLGAKWTKHLAKYNHVNFAVSFSSFPFPTCLSLSGVCARLAQTLAVCQEEQSTSQYAANTNGKTMKTRWKKCSTKPSPVCFGKVPAMHPEPLFFSSDSCAVPAIFSFGAKTNVVVPRGHQPVHRKHCHRSSSHTNSTLVGFCEGCCWVLAAAGHDHVSFRWLGCQEQSLSKKGVSSSPSRFCSGGCGTTKCCASKTLLLQTDKTHLHKNPLKLHVEKNAQNLDPFCSAHGCDWKLVKGK